MFRLSQRLAAVAARPARAFRAPAAGSLRRSALFTTAPRLLQADTMFPQSNAFGSIEVASDDSVTAPPNTVAETLHVRLSTGDANVLYGQSLNVVEITIPTVGGAEIGILPGHEYSVQRMDAGIITLRTATATHKFVSSGGFAHINDNGHIDINSVACYPLDQIDLAHVRSELEHCRSKQSSSDPNERFFAQQGVQLYETLAAALSGR
eukprot:TRINITY_DN67772_c0_g1_i1.p2 TRINITY_DN67772_c0_g1~~TRINITY_DN67772_c0_g1_i1.p2  ORF type:complete len:208 (-),score=31.65 TRINITY_DN67772_c0_g1_i1:466-1089(-)